MASYPQPCPNRHHHPSPASAMTPWLEVYVALRRTKAEVDKYIVEEPQDGAPIVAAALFQEAEGGAATLVTLRVSYLLPRECGAGRAGCWPGGAWWRAGRPHAARCCAPQERLGTCRTCWLWAPAHTWSTRQPPALFAWPAAWPCRRAAGVCGADGGVWRRGSQAVQVHGTHEGVHRGLRQRRGTGLGAGKHGSHSSRWVALVGGLGGLPSLP